MSQQTETITIRIREDGSRVVTRSFNDMASAGDRAAKTMSLVKGAIGAAVTGLVIQQVIKYADAWANAAGLIAIATKSQAEAVDVTKQLFAAAQRTRSAFTDVVNVYAAAARASSSLGASQKDTITFTEGLGKALAVQHVSAEDARGSLLQLGQLLASGKVHAQEFNSVLLGTPVILQTVAKGLGDATGNVQSLRTKMLAGTLTSKEFFDGFLQGLPQLDADFKKSAFTFSQGFTIINNSLQKFIGQLNETIGVSAAFGRIARFIADNMDSIGAAIIGAGKAALIAAASFGAFKTAIAATELASKIKEFVALRVAIAEGTVVQLGSAEAERQRTAFMLASAQAAEASATAQTAANVAVARSTTLATEATLADTVATEAALAIARKDAIAKLAQANSQIAAAKATQELAKANFGSLTSLRALEIATQRETVAEQARAAVLAELAVLGQQQARVTLEQTAAATANATAQAALNTVQAEAAITNAGAAAATAKAASASADAAKAAAAGTGLLAQSFNGLKTIVVGLFSQISKLFILINANPFVFLLTAIVAVIGFIGLFGDSINAGIDDVTTLQDVFVAFGLEVLDVLRPLGAAIAALFTDLPGLIGDVFTVIGQIIGPAVSDYLNSFDGFFDGVGNGFAGVLKGIARVVDAIAGLLTGLIIGFLRVFTGLPDAIVATFKRMFNVLLTFVEGTLNKIIDNVNAVRDAVGLSLIKSIEVTKLDVDEAAWTKYGKNIANSIEDGFAQQDGFAEKFVDRALKRAQNRAAERNLTEVQVAVHRIDQPQAVTPAIDPKELKKVQSALRDLLNTIDPISGALLEMAKAEQTLNDAQRLGLITGSQHIEYLKALKEHYRDILDPLGKINRELDEQTTLLGLNTRQREVEGQVLSITKQLLADGKKLTEEETNAMRAKLTALQALNEATMAQDQLLADSVGKRRDFVTQTQAIADLLKKSDTTGFGKGDAAQATVGIIQGMGLDPTGTQAAADANVSVLQTMYDQIQVLRDKNLISEQEAAGLTAQAWAKAQAERLAGASTFLGQLAQLQNSKSREASRIGKAAAIAQATIETYNAATKAYSSLANIPYVGPVLGAAAAAAAIKLGLDNIRAIRSTPTGYMSGGYTGNGAIDKVAGQVHGKEFVMNATATRRLGVDNLEALQHGNATIADYGNRRGGSGGRSGGGGGVHVSIENYGTSKTFDVQPLSADEVRIIARDEAKGQIVKETPKLVAGELAQPNSRISKSLGKSTKTERQR